METGSGIIWMGIGAVATGAVRLDCPVFTGDAPALFAGGFVCAFSTLPQISKSAAPIHKFRFAVCVVIFGFIGRTARDDTQPVRAEQLNIPKRKHMSP